MAVTKQMFDFLKRRKQSTEEDEPKNNVSIEEMNRKIKNDYDNLLNQFEEKQSIVKAFLDEIRPIFMKVPIDDDEIVSLYFNEVLGLPIEQIPMNDENRPHAFRLMTIVKRALQLSMFYTCQKAAENDGYFLGRTIDHYYYLLPFETNINDEGYFESSPQAVMKEWQEALGDNLILIDTLFNDPEHYVIRLYKYYVGSVIDTFSPTVCLSDSFTIDDILFDEKRMNNLLRDNTVFRLNECGAKEEIEEALNQTKKTFEETFSLIETLTDRMKNERQYIIATRRSMSWVQPALQSLEGNKELQEKVEEFIEWYNEKKKENVE